MQITCNISIIDFLVRFRMQFDVWSFIRTWKAKCEMHVFMYMRMYFEGPKGRKLSVSLYICKVLGCFA